MAIPFVTPVLFFWRLALFVLFGFGDVIVNFSFTFPATLVPMIMRIFMGGVPPTMPRFVDQLILLVRSSAF
jgi:hypothetical protein